jgi:hypothetical protein
MLPIKSLNVVKDNYIVGVKLKQKNHVQAR